jgi:hypothetical protein
MKSDGCADGQGLAEVVAQAAQRRPKRLNTRGTQSVVAIT